MRGTQEPFYSSSDRDVWFHNSFFKTPTLIIPKCKYDQLHVFYMLFYIVHVLDSAGLCLLREAEAYYGTF